MDIVKIVYNMFKSSENSVSQHCHRFHRSCHRCTAPLITFVLQLCIMDCLSKANS